ncbi:hypothetical protein ASPCAL04582 [Aspergillus calidoustus]|uniref:FAD-binding PCMH-type domain-containing protein n=1 Tax=Aspergillus calidoustus TaxID=454130 RepID=A0A0U5FVT3_ASPCI|nr:hypothetical protein ASPCAL04582 [Aspergillus calidoustus]
MHPNTSSCCVRLLALLGPPVSFPQTPAYNTSLASYFTQQNAHLYPSCIVTPSNTADVSTILDFLTSPRQDQNPTHTHASANTNTACPFAIRSGGHAYNTAFNNINSGPTIDLSNLNSITLSADQKTVSVGPGATWGDVYDILDPAHISVPGGRAGQVGVGGLTLGGGISYFSPRYGWTCDSVSEFEVVLAGGEVVSASQGYNRDLWISLCGGGPANFGIVTRVNLTTFPQGMIWGGFVYYTLDTIPEQLSAFEGFNTAESYDEHASLIMSFGFSAGVGGAVVNSVVYTKDEKYPAVYEPFFALPSLSSTVRVASLGEIAREQGSFSPDGRRQLSAVTTHTSTKPMLNATYNNWNASLASIEHIPGIVWSLSLEPLPPSIYARHANTNSMGLPDTPDGESLVVSQLSVSWDNEEDDETVERVARALVEGIERDAKALDAYEPFLYLNYAAEWQDPIASYGGESVERLRSVSREVDPRGMFRDGVKGFKIPG